MAGPDRPLDPAGRRWVLIAAILGSSMVFLDGSTVNVALPALQDSLGATVVDAQWVVNAYTLFLAALEPPSTLSAEERDAVRAGVDDAFLGGFRIVMASMAALAIVAAAVSWATVPAGGVRGGRAGEQDGENATSGTSRADDTA